MTRAAARPIVCCRRFANKEEVIDALFGQRLEQVAAIGEHALAEPDPWRGLVTYLDQILQLQMKDRGLTGIIHHPSLGQHRLAEASERIGPILNRLADRARQRPTPRSPPERSEDRHLHWLNRPIQYLCTQKAHIG